MSDEIRPFIEKPEVRAKNDRLFEALRVVPAELSNGEKGVMVVFNGNLLVMTETQVIQLTNNLLSMADHENTDNPLR